MKRTIIIILLAITVLFACSAGSSEDKEAGQPADNTSSGNQKTASNKKEPVDKDLSYAFGLALGTDLKSFGIEYDYNEFMKGFKDTIEEKNTRMTLEEAMMKIQLSINAMMEKQAAESKAKEDAFLAENGKKSGVITTASGLQYEILAPGSGPKPRADQTVVVNYVGTLTDGTKFDSSYDRNQPEEFPLNFVIPGWTEGIQLMSVGSKYRFYIPSALGYGAQGAGNGFIPPYSVLVFEVELLEFKDTDPAMLNMGY